MGPADAPIEEAVRLAAEGRGASALVSSEKGVHAHMDRFSGTQPFDAAMARAFARHAEVLHRFGDPDLAVASADLALRIYLNRQDEIDRTAFVRAATIAADIHQASGRSDIARSAAGLVTRIVPGAVPDPPVAAPEPLLDRVSLAQALRRVRPPPGVPASQLPDPQPLVDGLTAPAADCSLATTSRRCTPEDLPTIADLLASFAATTIDADPAAGLRLGLEAHVLYAHGSELQLPAMRYLLAEHGPPWARALLACARTCDRHGLAPLAADLAAWMAGVVEQLVPHAFIDDTVRATAKECVAWHADLLERTGQSDGGASARAMLRTFEQMG